MNEDEKIERTFSLGYVVVGIIVWAVTTTLLVNDYANFCHYDCDVYSEVLAAVLLGLLAGLTWIISAPILIVTAIITAVL